MISHRHRCIFVHIPKTAGNSVNRVFGVDWQPHKDLRRFAAELPADTFSSYFKFAVVRNPWERIFSDYNFQVRKSRPRAAKLQLFDRAGQRRSFRTWVDTILAHPEESAAASWGGEVSEGLHRWSPAVDWMTLNGRIAVDRVIRMERLPVEFPQVCRGLGLPAVRLPRRNRRWHLHYSWYYDDWTRARVGAYYAKDVETFGYRFEASPPRHAWLTARRGAVFALQLAGLYLGLGAG